MPVARYQYGSLDARIHTLVRWRGQLSKVSLVLRLHEKEGDGLQMHVPPHQSGGAKISSMQVGGAHKSWLGLAPWPRRPATRRRTNNTRARRKVFSSSSDLLLCFGSSPAGNVLLGEVGMACNGPMSLCGRATLLPLTFMSFPHGRR